MHIGISRQALNLEKSLVISCPAMPFPASTATVRGFGLKTKPDIFSIYSSMTGSASLTL